MSTATLETQPRLAKRPAREITPIPLGRLMAVELRKMFDTRAGFWLMASVVILSVLASAAVIAWAPDRAITLETFSTAIGIPLSVILPIIAMLSITSEYSQRSGLTTYTLVPWRGRVVAAKAAVTLVVGVVSMLVALAVGSLGTLVGSAIRGVDPTWNVTPGDFALIVLANVLGMAIGFTLGVITRSSPVAIVCYFVYSLVLPAALGTLAGLQKWFADLQPWVDVHYTITRLFGGHMIGEHWAQLGLTLLIWVLLPLALGIRLVLRSEVK